MKLVEMLDFAFAWLYVYIFYYLHHKLRITIGKCRNNFNNHAFDLQYPT